MSQPFVPNLTGRVDSVVEKAIRDLYTMVHGMSQAPKAQAPTPQNMGSPSAPPTPSTVTGPLGPAGNAPFPQIPQIPILNDVPPTGSPYNFNGALVLVNKVPYIYYNGFWQTYPPA